MIGFVRSGAVRLARSRAAAHLFRLLDRVDNRSVHLARILTYHRVDEPAAHPELSPTVLSATPEQFVEQMEFLAKNYRVLTMRQLDEAWQKDGELPPRSVLITFDDAYRDFQEIAWPVLKRLGLPATLFVATAYPDHPERSFWWDRLHAALAQAKRKTVETAFGTFSLQGAQAARVAAKAISQELKRLPDDQLVRHVAGICDALDAAPGVGHVLTWDELRQLATEGVTMGAHTRTHRLLDRISITEAREEAVGSLEDLRREIGDVPPVFAYPAGGHTPEVARMLEREQFRLAVTTERGVNDLRHADRMLLRRINVGQSSNTSMLRAQMLSCVARLTSG